MLSRRGRERRLVQPGELVAWDPSNAHAGTAVDGQPWSSRLIVVEVAGLAAIAGDQESDPLADIAFSEPIVSNPEVVSAFMRLHTALESLATWLERDEQLAEWLRALIGRFSTMRPRRAPARLRR